VTLSEGRIRPLGVFPLKGKYGAIELKGSWREDSYLVQHVEKFCWKANRRKKWKKGVGAVLKDYFFVRQPAKRENGKRGS